MTTEMREVDLTYINNISDGDRAFIKEMLETFLKITPVALQEITAASDTQNWKEVGRIAHKIKPTLMLIGDNMLSKMFKKLEVDGKNKLRTEQIPEKVAKINTLCNQTLDSIREIIDTESY